MLRPRRKSKEHNGYVAAPFDTPSAGTSQPASAYMTESSAQSPLHAPRFPIPVEHRRDASGSGYAVVPNTPTDATVIELSGPPRAGPLKALPVALYTGTEAGNGDGQEKTNIEQAAAAGVAATTPPPVDEEQWYRAQIDYVRNQVEQMENVEVQRGQEAQSIRSKWKRELFLLFEDPSSGPSAFIMNVFVTFMIIFSAVLTTVETMPSLRKGNTHMWLAFELVIMVVFTVEFVLRFLGHTDTWRQAWNHAKSAITIIDALAIFPFYIELILQRDTSYEFRFTILRIFRLLRVFSAFKYSSLLQLSIEVMIVAIKRSSDALLAFLLFVTLTVLLFSTLMYFAERGTWDDERQAFLTPEGEYSKFSSIPAAAYYSIVTLTTTGFGDMVPTTFIGKLVSFPMMIAGILLIALPSIIVGRNFTQVWEAARKLRGQRPSPSRMQRMGGTLVDDDDGYDEDMPDQCMSSGKHSPRLRHRRRMRKRTSPRRSGSISSFETESRRTVARSTHNGTGYATVSGGQRDFADSTNGVTGPSSDFIDALARKDSFEMQELAAATTTMQQNPAAAEHDERSDGYKQVETIYSDNNSDENSTDERPNEGPSWRSPRVRQKRLSAKGKERVESGVCDNGVHVSRLEWEAMNAELTTLRNAVGSNEQVLRAIASHLSIGLPPSHHQ
ncbi:hypothetical protein IWW50_001095 [Coemansia erecta]|nr:hypothetical protein GGF43_000842 [Coemansia sp. RSA 2618]KAJ2828986.1 hypothetical protein IWW50_001095 [Coemansia erecta]